MAWMNSSRMPAETKHKKTDGMLKPCYNLDKFNSNNNRDGDEWNKYSKICEVREEAKGKKEVEKLPNHTT